MHFANALVIKILHQVLILRNKTQIALSNIDTFYCRNHNGVIRIISFHH